MAFPGIKSNDNNLFKCSKQVIQSGKKTANDATSIDVTTRKVQVKDENDTSLLKFHCLLMPKKCKNICDKILYTDPGIQI